MVDEELKKSYYAIIPADVRYDERLPLGARLLYGEITALCNEKGYCWAGNTYFAELYKVSIRTVINWIKSLNDNGYLFSEFEYKENSKEISARKLKIIQLGGEKNFTGVVKNNSRGSEKNCTDNNTCEYITTISKDIVVGQQQKKQKKQKNKKFKKPTIEEIAQYCKERNNKIDANYFFDYYESKGWVIGKNPMKDWKAAVRTWELKDKKGFKNDGNSSNNNGPSKYSRENGWF